MERKVKFERIGCMESLGWSDEYFLENYGPTKIFNYASPLKIQKAGIKLLQVFNGSREPYNGVVRDMRILIFSMSKPHSDELLFKDIFSNTGVDLLSSDKLIGNVPLNNIDTDFYPPSASAVQLSEIENAFEIIQEKLLKFDDEIPLCNEKQEIINILGFLCMKVFELLVKEQTDCLDVMWVSLHGSIDRDYSALYGKDIDVRIPAPHFRNYEKLNLIMDILRPEIENTFFNIIVRYISEETKANPDNTVIQILMTSCLANTSFHGMLPIQLFEEIRKHFPLPPDTLFNGFDCNGKRTLSMVRLTSFYLDLTKGRQYKLPGYEIINTTKQYSWKWARIFNSHFFEIFSGDRNIPMCVKFAAVLLELKTELNILEMSLFQSNANRHNLSGLEDFAQRFVKDYTELCRAHEEIKFTDYFVLPSSTIS